MKRGVLLWCALLSTPTSAAAPENLGSFQVPECVVGLEMDRQNPEDINARLRPRCPLSLDASRKAYQELLKKVLEKQPDLAKISIFLGRAVDYTWLSVEIARRASLTAEWDRKTGRPRSGSREAFVAQALNDIPEMGSLFAGWKMVSFSAEKTLIANARTLGLSPKDARLPYDAMIWVRLQRNPGPAQATASAQVK